MELKPAKGDLTDDRTADFLARLRSQTVIVHKRLESLPISKLLVDPKITISDYTIYLTRMHDVVDSIETEVYPILTGSVPDLTERSKNDLLLADLQTLGINKIETVGVFDFEVIPSPAFAMGMLYVLEGSTLGGRFILKNIEENLGFDAKQGARYFAGYGNKTGSSWKNFLNTLTAFEIQYDAEAALIAGARYAFEAIEKHLSQTPA